MTLDIEPTGTRAENKNIIPPATRALIQKRFAPGLALLDARLKEIQGKQVRILIPIVGDHTLQLLLFPQDSERESLLKFIASAGANGLDTDSQAVKDALATFTTNTTDVLRTISRQSTPNIPTESFSAPIRYALDGSLSLILTELNPRFANTLLQLKPDWTKIPIPGSPDATSLRDRIAQTLIPPSAPQRIQHWE